MSNKKFRKITDLTLEQKGASIKVPAATYLTKESQQSNSDVKSSTPSMGLHASDLKNNKRRVSFGVIHAIPSIDASVEKQCNQVNSDDSDESDNKYTNNTNTNEQAEGPKNRKEVPMVIEYVDELLQQAIDEVLIAKE
jgi:hypothetical protein